MLQSLLTIPGDADKRRRGRTLVLIALLLLALVICALPITFTRPDPLPSMIAIGVGLVVIGATIALARAGRVALAGGGLVFFTTAATAIPTLLRPEPTSSIFYMLLPIVISGLVLRPWQVWPVVAAAMGVVALDASLSGPAALSERFSLDIFLNSALIMLTAGVITFIGARVIAASIEAAGVARAEAEAAARELAALNASLEDQVAARTAELRGVLAAVEARAAEKQALLDEVAAQRVAIREMSVPVLPVRPGTLVMPLVGALDSARLADLQAQALGAIERSHARTLVLDVTGVPVVDTQVAQGLLATVHAARLLGAEPVLVGVRPEVAQTLVALGVDLSAVRVAADLAGALG